MQALSMLIKPASGNCNMRCRYCFYADVMDAREVKNRGLMSLSTLETLVRKALSEARGSCSFGFQGGEPTLSGLAFYEALVDFQRQYNANGVQIHNAIQTNGLLMDERWAAFLAKHRFLVGLSVDAGPEVHDSLRLDAQRDGTHARCLSAAALMAKHGVAFNILSVITAQLAQHPQQVYRFYQKQGFGYVQFIPCLDGLDEAHGGHDHSLSARALGRFYSTLFDLWYHDFMAGDYRSVRAFDNYIHMLMGHPPENCGMVGHCQPYPVIEADGTVYPCDFYVLDNHCLGNIHTHGFEEMLTSPAAQAFAAPSRRVHPQCKACEFGFICRGGCRRDREPLPQEAPGLNRYCEGYKAFFAYALPRMRQVAQMLMSQGER